MKNSQLKSSYKYSDWLKQSEAFLKTVMKSYAQISNLPPNSHRVCRKKKVLTFGHRPSSHMPFLAVNLG